MKDVLSAIRKASQRGLRLAGRVVHAPRARVIYHPDYRGPSFGLIDGKRATKIAKYLIHEGALFPWELRRPGPLDVRALLAVHDPDYLDALDRPESVERVFAGLGEVDHEGLLSGIRAAVAGTLLAADLTWENPRDRTPIFNLSGGFHHAGRAHASGYSVFNDVAVGLSHLRGRGFLGPVVVLDLDYHQGDGTREMLEHMSGVTCVSIHARDIVKTPTSNAVDLELGSAVSDATYLSAIRTALGALPKDPKTELAILLLGADVAASDPMTDWQITDEAVFERDRMVLDHFAHAHRWVLPAGGYGPNAWRLTARTIMATLTGDDSPIPTREDRFLDSMREIRDELGRETLATEEGDPFVISERDLYGDLLQGGMTDRFLGTYSAFGLRLAFERYGLGDHLRKKGYATWDISMTSSRSDRPSLTVRSAQKETLMELVVNEELSEVTGRCLSIEWLLLQDPQKWAGRPLLAGQNYPGLGCLDRVVGMLVMMAERLGFDALSLVPAHFHVATRAKTLFEHEDPIDEARFLALQGALTDLDRRDAAAALGQGRVIDSATGQAVFHVPKRMIRFVDPNRQRTPAYQDAVSTAAKLFHFELRAV